MAFVVDECKSFDDAIIRTEHFQVSSDSLLVRRHGRREGGERERERERGEGVVGGRAAAAGKCEFVFAITFELSGGKKVFILFK